MKICIEDKDFPESLKNIKYAPKELYVLGNKELLNKKCFAIVGSRVCSDKGIKTAEEFARKLCKQNICIVSGMALGIDTGSTIAVLGSGFKHIFPRENKQLFKQIIENGGAIISEYKESVEVTSQGFALRNRIVSGLSMGVLVVEAKHRSGTAITAEFAIKQGKKLFCIPHGLEEKEGIGTNRLIKNGAKLVTRPEDILEELKIVSVKMEPEDNQIHIDLDKQMVPKDYYPVYKHIGEKPINIDELCKKTSLDISKVNYILTMLELEGFIKQLPGKYFVI